MNVYKTSQVRNVVFLGHGGAGKTTLAEAMAYATGVITRMGSVDNGNTISDYDSEEIKRKFSINAAVIPIEWNGLKINILDAPGYFDFVGQTEDAMSVADAEITVTIDEHQLHGKKLHILQNKSVEGKIADVTDCPVDEKMLKIFEPQIAEVDKYVSKQIGTFKNTIYSRDSYFGSSAFNDFILNLELQITHADIAFNAPLQFNSSIQAGPIRVSDMFKLYKYENQLYVMRLTGKEIRRHLEMSYDLWVNTMKSPDDHLLLLDQQTQGDQQRLGFKNFSFNFDSAAGIDYEVDVTKPDGEKIRILGMSNGEPFDENKWYKVAVNSYRGNGGGELLTRGAGIPKDSLESRIIWRSERDQRYYLMQEIEKMGTVDAKPNNNWRFVPEEWVKPAAERDFELLFKKK